MYINRIHNPIDLIQKKSYFLFGARSIGKSALIHKLLPENYAYINLVSTDVFLRLAAEPSLLESMIMTKKFVVIDEIQKLPILLDEVHRLIEERQIHFLLTGSSARSLKRKSANLLGGRAQQTFLFPLTYAEIKNFDLEKHLLYGGIPRVHLAVDPELELDSYLQVYLEQEIQIEANLRSLPPFSRFLKVAAISNAQLINYSSIASDCGVSENTVKEYYQILVDTLIGFRLEPWLGSKKRKAIATSKFYFFDLGVRNFICGIKAISRDSKDFGDLFEHFIINEIKAYITYKQKRMSLNFWRSTSKHEVDLILDSKYAVEIKATRKVGASHLSSLRALQEEKIVKKYLIISNDPIERSLEGVDHYHWKKFLKLLWRDEFF